MNTQQIHDYYVEPALKALGKSFNHANARFLILCTLAVESDMGEFILQVGKNNISKIDIDRINDQIDNGKINIGLGIGQLESKTIKSIFCYSDNIQKPKIKKALEKMMLNNSTSIQRQVIDSPLFSCALMRLLYSMFKEPIPKLTGDLNKDILNMYEIYKKQIAKCKIKPPRRLSGEKSSAKG